VRNARYSIHLSSMIHRRELEDMKDDVMTQLGVGLSNTVLLLLHFISSINNLIASLSVPSSGSEVVRLEGLKTRR
jgi:hypothetical protein